MLFTPVVIADEASSAVFGPNIVAEKTCALLHGVYEVVLTSDLDVADPFFGSGLKVTFTRPNAIKVTVDGFYDGVHDEKAIFRARAYCNQPGQWSWNSHSNLPCLDGHAGDFTVIPSSLPGKLRIHPGDPHQFVYDNGDWFLHIGDTGYRYPVASEPEWRTYLDQAVEMGATKIRAWFCQSRSGVEALFTEDRKGLNLPYWQEIDRRVQYALNHYPQVIIQLIPYGEDTQELLRYSQGDRMSRFAAQYAQARLSACPNIIWCVSNDHKIVAEGAQMKKGSVPGSVIDLIAREMADRESWGTLLTNHQARHTGYAFTDAPWSDITTLEDLDQVHGAILLEYRKKSDAPVINDEDRYELYKPPTYPRYYFRRLMWSSLLSGGSASYGGARTYEPYNGHECGVRGYFDLKKDGILSGGADDFIHIHAFFRQAGITLVGMNPADGIAGGAPYMAKVIKDDKNVIVYYPNPDCSEPGKANVANTKATGHLQLPLGAWSIRWFNPQTGEWSELANQEASESDSLCSFSAPFTGDAVLLVSKSKGK